MPLPTERTAIHSKTEEENEQIIREMWIDRMHGGDKALWRSIEADNQFDQYLQYLKSDKSKRGEDEVVAGGLMYGRWIERGSNNNAGNIMIADYDVQNEMVYAVGGGGAMFKGDLSGLSWQPVNDKLRFSTRLLKIFNPEVGKKRIVSAINGIPHYSDDEGRTWISSSGVTSTSDGWAMSGAETTQDGKIFLIEKNEWYGKIKIYFSNDFGKTFKQIKIFATSDTRNISLAVNGKNGDMYAIEQISAQNSNLYKFNPQTKSLVLKQNNQTIGFGEEGRANIQVATIRDTTNIFAYNGDNKFYVSKDEGKTWNYLSTLPATPWEVSLYVCPSDPAKMFFGEVDGFRSFNGGRSWIRINQWFEYYGNIYGKLHADIMFIKEFRDKSGFSFILNGNHGGLYYSEDYGLSHTNIGLSGLNVSQYYDVKSYPSDPNRVFAGSQDQGQQRGLIYGEETSDLFQNVSGDYGHLIFTGNGKSLWSVYPGGSIGFYSQPLVQKNPIAAYEIDSDNETVWIPPIVPGPDPSGNIILAAGGSINKTSGGSFIIQLEYVNGNITASELPFDFSVSGGQISAIAIDPSNKNRWYVATTNGYFYRSDDSGQTFTEEQRFLSESHYLYGSCILPSSVYPDVVFLSGNGYSNKPVYRSEDGGRNFSEMSDGLPATTVFEIAANEDESLIFAATEAGPYVYIKEKNMWFELSGSLTPEQTFWSVEYIPGIKTARFATYGRGIWDFNVKEMSSSSLQTVLFESWPKIYPNPARDFVAIEGEMEHLAIQVTIFDFAGREVSRQTILFGQTVSLNTLLPGNYILSISDGKNKWMRKLIKQ